MIKNTPNLLRKQRDPNELHLCQGEGGGGWRVSEAGDPGVKNTKKNMSGDFTKQCQTGPFYLPGGKW